MTLELIGKTAPLPGEMQKTFEDGIQKVELYMKEEFLDSNHLKFISDAKRDLGMEFYSIHTPHSKPKDFPRILKSTVGFAKSAKIPVIVVHSAYVDVFSEGVRRMLRGKMFPENGHTHNLPFLENVMKKGTKICFDTAHFYFASLASGRDYYEDVESLLGENSDTIGHMHIADCMGGFVGKKVNEIDNYDASIGDGEIDFLKLMKIISKNYDGVAVVEVKVERQPADMEKLREILSFKTRRTA